MVRQFKTEEEANLFIGQINSILGYPDLQSGTLTYSVPEKVEQVEDSIIIGFLYEVPVTEEVENLLNAEENEEII